MKNLLRLQSPHLTHPRATDQGNQQSLSGLHIVANLAVSDTLKLIHSNLFREFINDHIEAFNLAKVGEVYHEFPKGGYTAVVCLTESHLSIHTWPENKYLTFDIFLSNYLKDNRPTTRALYNEVKMFFQAIAVFEQSIER